MASLLSGQVALVTGATRAAGRGIAVELGAAGATVYCTGRTSRDHRSEYDRPETIEETAELVRASGGIGVAVRVDHTSVDQVAALFRQIDTEQNGRLDIVVNDIWGGDPFLGDFSTPFGDQDLHQGLKVPHNAVDTHIITSWHAAPLMLRQGSGLIVEVTDGEPEEYHDHLFYDLPKKSLMRLAVTYAHELGPHGITGVAISPGWLRSERMLENFKVTEESWQDWYWDSPIHDRQSGSPQKHRATPDEPSSPSQQIPTSNGGTVSQSTPPISLAPTDSPTSTEHLGPRDLRMDLPPAEPAIPRGLQVKPSSGSPCRDPLGFRAEPSSPSSHLSPAPRDPGMAR